MSIGNERVAWGLFAGGIAVASLAVIGPRLPDAITWTVVGGGLACALVGGAVCGLPESGHRRTSYLFAWTLALFGMLGAVAPWLFRAGIPDVFVVGTSLAGAAITATGLTLAVRNRRSRGAERSLRA